MHELCRTLAGLLSDHELVDSLCVSAFFLLIVWCVCYPKGK